MNSYTASLRGKIWKILLGVYRVSASEYLKYVSKRKSKFYDKIKNDGFRTLRTDEKFKQKVTDNMIVRLLNAFVWSKEKGNFLSKKVLIKKKITNNFILIIISWYI